VAGVGQAGQAGVEGSLWDGGGRMMAKLLPALLSDESITTGRDQ
jgi:hypothetical protein